MQKISIHIPDTQVSFMMELLQKFDFVKIDNPTTDKSFTLSAEQKALVEVERIKAKNNPDYLLDWDNVKDTLIVD
jgi:hypothetical protein